MAKRTNKYGLTYFEQGDFTSAQFEMQRWETLDAQLNALFAIMGNGVLNGWNILRIDNGGLACEVTKGSGHVGFVAAESISSARVSLTPSATNYIYAQLTTDSYWTKNVSFVSFVDQLDADNDNNLFLGAVATDINGIVEGGINQDGKTELGFVALINNAIEAHKHDGADGNPDPIDLGKEVQGVLGIENLPDLDASKIQAGIIDDDRIPKIDHLTKVTNGGTLTHAQLDAYVEALSLKNPSLMGEVSTVNLLQLILSLKHIYPDIDEFLVNEIAFIPGISPDDYVDTVNTTAQVDTRTYAEGGTHQIYGVSNENFKAYTKTWGDNRGFKKGTLSNAIVNGDVVVLNTEVNQEILEDFNDIEGWDVFTTDLSAIDTKLILDDSNFVSFPASAQLSVGSQAVEVQLLLQTRFSSHDWSNYDFLTFNIFTKSVQHGDLFFYFKDKVYGEQDSTQKVLKRNAITIDENTLDNGWQEVTIDLRPFNREQVVSMGFYVSTQEGWDTSKGFDLNLDIFMLDSGNIYKKDGYIRLTYGGSIPQDFWRIRWDSIMPSDDLSDGVELKVRTRVSNDLLTLPNAAWSPYFYESGTEIDIPENDLYQYIEIEFYFTASETLKRSSVLKKVYLDYHAIDSEGSFHFDDQEQWESGFLYNVDTQSNAGSISINGVGDFENIIYGTQGRVKQIDSNLKTAFDIYGTLMPISTDQALNKTAPSFGMVTGVARGDNGNIWITDTDNNRVFEITKYGQLVKGFQGSFLTPPFDPFGVEEQGPGSNVADEKEIAKTDTEGEESKELKVLHSLYNESQGILYVVFDSLLENIYAPDAVFDISKFHLRVGPHKVWLNGSEAKLWGVDKDKYDAWINLNPKPNEEIVTSLKSGDALRFLKQFKFSSHVLEIALKGADRTQLDYMVNQKQPSVILNHPSVNEPLTNSDVEIKFSTLNFSLKEGGNGVEVTLDGNTQTIHKNSIIYNDLSDGNHTLTIQLKNEDGSLNWNVEAITSSNFSVLNSNPSKPYLYFKTPKSNQIYSSSPVSVDFEVLNFPILFSGQHLQYQVDSNPTLDHYTSDPITLMDIGSGKHSLRMWLVDDDGNALPYQYGEATADFIVGLNSNATTKLFVNEGAISGLDGEAIGSMTNLTVDVENIIFSNVYAPIDVQIIPFENVANSNGLPTLVVAKMRSQNTTTGLGSVDYAIELGNRILKEVQDESSLDVALNADLSHKDAIDLVYGDRFLDGHSVVQINMNGEIIFSNNAALFAKTKEEVKEFLGSAEKIGNNELLIGDSVRKRAIVVNTDLTTQVPEIVWQYDSDRMVVDFHLDLQPERRINIYDGSLSEALSYIKIGADVIWTNESSIPISIYSGSTDFKTFIANPNLNLYGDVFSSPVIQPGESYVFKFEREGSYPWFVYPTIISGVIEISKRRMSSQDNYVILESDGLESPFSSRVIKVDSWGNVIWSFGESYLVKPRDAKPILNNKVLIST